MTDKEIIKKAINSMRAEVVWLEERSVTSPKPLADQDKERLLNIIKLLN